MTERFYDALSCPLADYLILQETVIEFKCPKCRWRCEFEPNAANDYARLRIQECFGCEHRGNLKQYEIFDGKCKEVEKNGKES